mmetsp:Transcript_17733/g.40928  ORF Transcript_17733/g.40928 Transcript_17733/m.40928 type:complete len:88 (+) Transcript_17733:226-489(+)
MSCDKMRRPKYAQLDSYLSEQGDIKTVCQKNRSFGVLSGSPLIASSQNIITTPTMNQSQGNGKQFFQDSKILFSIQRIRIMDIIFDH